MCICAHVRFFTRSRKQNVDFHSWCKIRNIRKSRTYSSRNGAKINYAGGVLDGISLKLVINSKLAVEYAAMAEMVAFLAAAGKDAKRYLDIAASTAPFSARGVREARYMLDGNETVRVKISQLVKDSANHIEQCKTYGVQCPMAEAANAVFRKACDEGYGELDAVALARIYQTQFVHQQAA